ncbi:MAG: imidazole glycerol phosphate synthase subunit HisF [Candidatus Marinimicrobia bacterium]|nr:imidazole glycerol phosphate synthase subunit HisF [Candidatus Neomarinimicrobiota bacterium]
MPNHLKSPMFRVIPKLDIKGDSLVKGVNLEGLRVLGRPELFAKKYYDEGADEIIYQDMVASLYGKNTLFEIVEKTAKNILIPLSVGGGIRSIDDIIKLLKAGADKVCINSAAVKNPNFLSKAAQTFGSSTISVTIEANKIDNKYLVFTESGRNCSNKTVVDWVKQIQSLGAGEIILTSISKEGLGEGFDIELIEQIEKITNVPLVIHGGAGRISDIEKIISKYKISGAAIASAFHYYYLKNFQKAEQSSGNKDFSLGLRGEMEYNSFSLPQVKEITKKY